MRRALALLLLAAWPSAALAVPLGDCGSEGGVAGRGDIIFCEPFERSTWYSDEGFTDTDSNPADVGDMSRAEIVSGGVSGNCLKVSMLTGETEALSVKWHPALAGLAPDSLYLRYYIKLGPDWSPDMCDTPGHVYSTGGGKFPGLADERVTSDPSGQCGNGGEPGDGINCWSMRADYRACGGGSTDICSTVPGAITRFGSYLYFYGQEGSTGSAGLWDSDYWGQSTGGGGECDSTANNVFCGTDAGGVFVNDQWYCVEMFVKMNTPDVANGVIRGYVNGVLNYEKTNMIFRLTGHDNLHVRTVWLDVYKGGVYGNCNDSEIYLDQLVVAGNAEIGTFSAASAYDYASIPDNTWTLVESGGITDPAGTVKPVRGLLAYSGMAYDSDHNSLLAFGGGHADYAGNEVWKFDINTATWTMMYAPDAPDPATLCPDGFDDATYPGAVFNPSGESLADATPLVSHDYDSVEWIPSHGMFVIGAYTWGANQDPVTGIATPVVGYATPCYQWNPLDTWTYSPTLNKWTWRNVARATQPLGIAAAAYDPVDSLMYVIDRNSTWTYTPSTDAWTQLSPGGTTLSNHPERGMDYDSSRHCMYAFGGLSSATNELWKYDIAANSWSLLSPSGTPPGAAGGYGVAYDSANDVLVVVRGSGTANTYIYNPTTNAWSNPSPSSPPPCIDNIHGDLKYDSADNVTFLLTYSGFTVQTWAYRYAAASEPVCGTPGGL